MPQTIGQYRILDALGRGGMGVVFRAQHLQSGETVALKTVLVPDQSLLQGIRREIQALARLRHPGVVRILDEGLEDGLPWYAMELLEGVELRQYCSLHSQQQPLREAPSTPVANGASARGSSSEPYKLWTLPLDEIGDQTPRLEDAPQHPAARRWTAPPDLDTTPRSVSAAPPPTGRVAPETGPLTGDRSGQAAGTQPEKPPAAGGALRVVLSIVRRLCTPLAFLHGEGIVHLDLKPGNVLVRPDGMPVLMDFGLVSHFGGKVSREALDIGEVGVGTVGYMAPEQIRGEMLDARADLYSLGCILYELVTGRQPFVRASVQEVARAHLKAAPLPPSQFVEGVPPELDTLVLQLLAKRPKDRLGHADAVAAALIEIGAEGEPARFGPPPRPYLYRPGFAGRAEPLAVLEQHLADLQRRNGAVVLVGGESGVGKTRLAMELAHRAAAAKGLVLTGECLDLGGRPLEALRKPLQALADRCRAKGEQETERLFGPRSKVLALYEPALDQLPGQERWPEPAELQGAAAVARVQTYLAETIEALASTEPVLLVIDDLQWADELLLGALEFLARGGRLDHVPLLVLAMYRTEEVGRGLEKLLLLEGCSRLDLGRLNEEAVGSIVGDMLGLAPPPQLFSEFLARQSEGNPFFVAEYLRTAVAESILWRDGRGRWRIAEDRQAEATLELYERLPLPSSLRDLVRRRLDGLPESARRLAEAAAVLGRESPLGLLRPLSSLEEGVFLEAVSELLRRQVLEGLGPARLRFVHDKVREVAYSGLSEEDRRRLHALAAQALSDAQAGEAQSAAEIARHFDAAGAVEEARAAYQRAAEEAGQRYANEEALRLYGRAEALWQPQQTEEALRVRTALALGQARIRRLLGRYTEAEQDLSRAGQMAERLGDRRQQGLALVERAEIAWRTSAPQETERLADAAEALGRAISDPALQAAAARHRAIARFYQGQKSEAITEMERARQIARDCGDQALELQVTENLASLLFLSKRPSLAIPLLEDLVPRYRAAGSRERLCGALIMLGQALTPPGAFARALHCLGEALNTARAIGSADSEMRALGSLAECHDDVHQVYKALDAATRAARLAQELGDRMALALSLRLRCQQLRHIGDFNTARILLPQAMEAAETARAHSARVLIAMEEAHLAAAAGAATEVLAAAGRALGLLVPQDDAGRGLGYLLRANLARAALKVGAPDLARALVKTMQQQVLDQTRIHPEDLGWFCLILPVLLQELEGPPLEGLSHGQVPEADAAEGYPQQDWTTAHWVGWGRKELRKLLEALPAELRSGFLGHPDYQLGSLEAGIPQT